MGRTGQHHDVQDEILRVDHLPPLSVTATRLIEAVGDPDVEVSRLAGIIEQDPGLTARILGLANSAFFGERQPVLSVEQATIRVLGLNLVKSLALSMALAGSFQARGCPGFDLQDYWLTALGTASLCQAVGRRLREDQTRPVEAYYLGGLLHDLGLLLLVHVRPAEVSAVLEELQQAPGGYGVEQVGALEHRLLGIDRWQAGEWVAFRWHLPEVLVHTLGHLTNTGYDGPHAPVVRLVRGARCWVDAMKAGAPVELRVPDVAPDRLLDASQEIAASWEELRAMTRNLV